MKLPGKWFIHKKNVLVSLPVIPHQSEIDTNYELGQLQECVRNRDLYIERMARWAILDIDVAIAEYETKVAGYTFKQEYIMGKIFQEKLSQLKSARTIVTGRTTGSAPA